ncbi:MAG: hypothetical protein AAGA48_08230 [Myxococcota bacterium]
MEPDVFFSPSLGQVLAAVTIIGLVSLPALFSFAFVRWAADSLKEQSDER